MIDHHDQRLRASVEAHEGLRLHPYRDSVGKLTIGFGRNLDDVGISREEATAMLRRDLRLALIEARRLEYWPTLSDVRQRVVAEMVFNLGMPRFRTFRRMETALALGDYPRAAAEMLDSRWSNQVGARAERLAERMRTGTDDG